MGERGKGAKVEVGRDQRARPRDADGDLGQRGSKYPARQPNFNVRCEHVLRTVGTPCCGRFSR